MEISTATRHKKICDHNAMRLIITQQVLADYDRLP
jgi:hypothetical protein